MCLFGGAHIDFAKRIQRRTHVSAADALTFRDGAWSNGSGPVGAMSVKCAIASSASARDRNTPPPSVQVTPYAALLYS